jgi:hypothetical protein
MTHCQRPWCCKAPVSSVALFDGNATLQVLQLTMLQAHGNVVTRGAAAYVAVTCNVVARGNAATRWDTWDT